MKDHSHKSHRSNKESHSKRDRHNGSSRSHPEKHREVLKERPHREDSDHKRSEKSHHNSSKDRHRNGRSESSNDRHERKKPDVFSSSGRSEDRNRKHRQSAEESYEELSRKKRKIESELKALDMEEAAERTSKRKDKDTSNHHRKKRDQERIKQEVHIKEEPASDNDQDRPPRDNRNRKRRPIKPDPDRNPSPEPDWGRQETQQTTTEKPKEKPNFSTSGKLAEDTNTYNGVVIKYSQPAEARKPKRRWRLYPFKGDSDLPFIPIHRQSAYLFGRTRSIADIPIDHPSCSKQHAVLQFRLVSYKRDDGTTGRRVRPYIIDLESSNGTFVNNKRIDPRCYVELIEKDVVKFGYSSREYVILHEESKNDDYEDLEDSSPNN